MRAADYYDDFADKQVHGGIHARHLSIDRWLAQFGLVPGMDVLEIGSGVGTQTELVAKRLGGSGSVTGVDLSPRSIELARSRLEGWSNVRLIAGNAVEIEIDGSFDVVLMPDVIEHIPVEQHRELFAKVRRWLRDTGWVLIHMPNPFYLEWCRHHRPDVLQVIDQPIYTEMLIASIEPNDLYIHHLQTYPIWVAECDYQVVVLRPKPLAMDFGRPFVVEKSLVGKLVALGRGLVGRRS